MKIAVIGATGFVGATVVAEALARGHAVGAIARHPEKLADAPGLTRIAGDVLDADRVAALVAGYDYVVSAYNPGWTNPDIYNEYRKDGRPPSIRASYYTGLRMFEEWVCLEHEGYARKKARDWWRQRALTEPPETVVEGFQRLAELRTPTQIKVWVNKKHPEIMTYEYDQ